ncbi:uncharacterized protein LOC134265118 [Saccostrea cucullata]|uniref:uncharacterized protein LOC134265118 n=1 Tax=Saccostrea cuccullata TaxID=36930 RepID=UPI002ED695F0
MARAQSSPDPWTSWLNGWTYPAPSADLGMEPTSTTTSNISLRLDQKVNGLFDNEYAGIMDDFAGNKMDSILDKEFLISEKSNLGMEGGEVEDFLEAMGSTFPGDDFLNSFMDLSNFTDVQENEDKPELALTKPVINFAEPEPSPVVEFTAQQDEEMVVPETEEVITVECGKKRKRTVTDEEEGLAAAGLDHDYITKKPRTSTVTVELGNETDEDKATSPDKKYVERRVKNNIASKRSRYVRKMKFVEMESEAERLVQENQRMRLKIEELEQLAKEMKAALINKLAEKK